MCESSLKAASSAAWPVVCNVVGMIAIAVQVDPVADAIIGAAIDVHRALGPGLMESAYRTCLQYELFQRDIQSVREAPVPVVYKGQRIDCGYRADLIVDGDVLVEVKSVEALLPIHTAQVLTYLRLTGARRAFLMNFNGITLKEGLRSYLGNGKGNNVPISGL